MPTKRTRINQATKANIAKVIETKEGISEYFVATQNTFNIIKEKIKGYENNLEDMAYELADTTSICPTCNREQHTERTQEIEDKIDDIQNCQAQLEEFRWELDNIQDYLAHFDPEWLCFLKD